MSRPSRPLGLNDLRQAFDHVRFGPQRTLNLRETLPTAVAAVARTDAWLRQHQVDRTDEVLIITGRGNQSPGGVSAVREAVIRHLHLLKRRGVVERHQEHTPGSFIVALAPVAALWESPRRNRGRGASPPSPPVPASLDALDAESRAMLRSLAERALDALGVKDAEMFLQGEMLRQFAVVSASIGDQPDREARLRAALRTALDQYD